MKGFKLCFLLFFTFIISHSAFSQDTIHWRSDYRLKWDDFQGIPDSSSLFKAVTVANISSVLSYNNSTFNVKISCTFEKSKSWTLSSGQILLLHEQGHFDIAELFARKLRKVFKKYTFNAKTIEKDYNNIFTKIKMERAKMDSLYDKETNLSRNKSKQLYWNNKIKAELKKLETYKG